jgi:DNA-binding MarR family transcriptional regulator
MDKNILFELKSLQNELIRKTFHHKNKDRYVPITPVQMQIIEYLSINKNKKIFQKDLENFLDIRKSTLSGILDTMEKHKIIKKTHSKNDLRSKKISFTKGSILKQQEIKKHFDLVHKTLINDIPKNKLDIFFEVIDLMKEKLIINNKDVKNI